MSIFDNNWNDVPVSESEMHERYEPAMTIAATLNNGVIQPNHPSHDFTGIDGRCYDCDCRPYGRHAPLPCTTPWG